MLQITPNYYYKCSCALHSPSPNSVQQYITLLIPGKFLSCLSLSAQLSACPNLSCPCALTLSLSLEAPLACSSLISCMCCTEHLGCFPLVYHFPAPSASVFYLLRMSAMEINLPSSTYFSCTMSCTFLSDDLDFPMIPSSTVSIGHKSCTFL